MCRRFAARTEKEPGEEKMGQEHKLTGVHDGLFVDDNIGRVGSGSRYSGCDGRAVGLQDDTIVLRES